MLVKQGQTKMVKWDTFLKIFIFSIVAGFSLFLLWLTASPAFEKNHFTGNRLGWCAQKVNCNFVLHLVDLSRLSILSISILYLFTSTVALAVVLVTSC